jgi:ribosome-associated heat shock protein Hsp15
LDRQRIDKWLWHARVVRTRSAAAALAASGHVRVNGQRIDMPSRAVRLGDVITVALDRSVRVLKVAGFAERRGAAETASMLAEDLSQPSAEAPLQPAATRAPAAREPGTGRPTKRDRRAIDRLFGDDGF